MNHQELLPKDEKVKKNECKRKCSLDLEELVVAGLIKRGHRRTIINQRVSLTKIFYKLYI